MFTILVGNSTMSLCICPLPALPAEFTMTLDDTVAVENTAATFTCKVNDEEAEVNWTLDKKPLPQTDKFKTQQVR